MAIYQGWFDPRAVVLPRGLYIQGLTPWEGGIHILSPHIKSSGEFREALEPPSQLELYSSLA